MIEQAARKAAALKKYNADYVASEHGQEVRRANWQNGGAEKNKVFKQSAKYKTWLEVSKDDIAAKRKARRAKPESKAQRRTYYQQYRTRPGVKEKEKASRDKQRAKHWDPVCNKGFAHESYLENHLATSKHGKEAIETRFYSCDTCDEAFRDQNGLDSHLESDAHATTQAEFDLLMEDVIPFPWDD